MKKTFLLPILLALGAYLLLPLPGLSAPLTQKIEKKRSQIEQKKRQEGVLSTTIQRFDTRIDAVEGEMNATQKRLDRAQASLDAQKAELLEVRDRLEEARDRLERCAASSPPRGRCSRRAWSRSTRPTPRTC